MNRQEIEMSDYFEVLDGIKKKIAETQYKVLSTANVERNILYWNIGNVIIEHSAWGSQFVKNLAKDLRLEYPNVQGYSERNLNYMKQFALRITDKEILHRVGAKLNWKSIMRLIDKTNTPEEHIWYAMQCIENGWSSTVLVHQIESKLYERQALATKDTNFKQQLLSPLSEQAEEMLKDPYIFDFIPNAKSLKETELENAMVQQVTKVLLEFGSGFAFMGNQYHITVGKRDFYIDLLFYNVNLRCYFVVELKTVEFEPEFAGKLSFYLSAVDEILRKESDNPTIGLVLCKEKDRVVAEYALKDINKPMGISEYRLVDTISDELKASLPAIEEIESRIEKMDKK